jgi:Ca2+-binding EF-hand superfamily protein
LLGKKTAEELGYAPGTTQYDKIIAAWLKMWEIYLKPLDKDGDDAVTLDEWLEMSVAYQDAEVADPVVQTAEGLVFDAIDADGDGRISLREYLAFMRGQRIPDAHAQEAFSKFDADSDGFLTRHEFLKNWLEYAYSDDPKAVGNWFYPY